MKRKMMWALLIPFLFGGWLIATSFGPGGDGVLDRLSDQNGGEYLITQRWNSWTEPYTVDFWFRTSGGHWGWCYVDHESTRWKQGTLQHDVARNSIRILRGGDSVAELLLASSTFVRHGALDVAVPAPQELRNPPQFAGR